MHNSPTAIMTGSGRFFDPLNPKPDDVALEDIARGLRRGVTRFNGQLLDPDECPHPQSGASHCMRVARITYWKLAMGALADTDEITRTLVYVLAALLHDAPEGYTGDRLGPIKTDADRAMESGVLAAVVEHLVGAEYVDAILALPSDGVVKWADLTALAQEALLYQPGAQVWASPHGCKRIDIAETLHLFHPREGESWDGTVIAVSSMLLAGVDDQNAAQVIGRLATLMC